MRVELHTEHTESRAMKLYPEGRKSKYMWRQVQNYIRRTEDEIYQRRYTELYPEAICRIASRGRPKKSHIQAHVIVPFAPAGLNI